MQVSQTNLKRQILELNNIVNQIDLADIYRAFRPNTREYTFFSVARETFSKIDCIFGNQASLDRYKKINITPCILSDHHGLKVDINKISNTKYTKL